MYYVRVMGETSFVKWLLGELNERDMTQADLARRAGLSSGTLSNITSGDRNPGERVCRAIAQAFGIPAEEVMRRAGILPALPKRTERIARMVALLEELEEDDQSFVEEFTRLRVEYQRRRGRSARGATVRPSKASLRSAGADVEGTDRPQSDRGGGADAGAAGSQESETDSAEDTTPNHDTIASDSGQ